MTVPGPRATVLTAASRGAVAVVRVWGAGSVEAADAVFRPHRGRSLRETPPGQLRVGRVGAGAGDEVVAVRLEHGDVEFQGHGGPAALALVMQALENAGVRAASASEWLASRGRSRIQVEVLEDLARTETLRASEILLEQSEGALETDITRLLTILETEHQRSSSTTDTSPARPVAPDPNGDLRPENPRTEALAALDVLLARAEVGRKLVTGWTVALAGRPNVGKSRLLNALAGFARAIVDPTPGTTRDVVTLRTALGGWPVELADTAGLRDSDDPIEAAGVARARATQAGADLVLLVLDGSEPLTEADRTMIDAFPKALRVANKSDLPAAWPVEALGARPISAERGDGLDGLIRDLADRLVPQVPPAGAGVPFRDSHVRVLEARTATFDRGASRSGGPAAEPADPGAVGTEVAVDGSSFDPQRGIPRVGPG